MLASLPDWFVADEQVDAPVVGGVLYAGLRLSCTSLDPAEPSAHPVVQLPDGTCVLTGRTGPAEDVLVGTADGGTRRVAAELPLDVGAFSVLVSTQLPTGGLVAGAAVRATGTLRFVAAYEWEPFALPDVRRDWRVLSVAAGPEGLLVDLEPA